MTNRIPIGLVRVITLQDSHALNIHGRIIEEKIPFLQVISECIKGFPKGIYDVELERRAIPQILEIVRKFEEKGVKAVIISCADDPGVKEAKKIVKIPVIGAGSAAASLALAYGDKIGVLGITEYIPKPIKEVLRNRIIGYEKPKGIRTTLDISKNKSEIISSVKRLVNYGSDVIVLGCTGYSTARVAKLLKEVVDIPVIDPVVAAGLITYYIVTR